MKHQNENAANQHTGFSRREFVAMLAGCTAGLMVPSLFPGEEKLAVATASPSDRLGKLLPLRKLGSSGPVVTNLGVGGDHVGSASEKDAQAIIEKALEEGVRFFDNAPLYSSGKAEERYGKFLTSKYRDVSFIMTKTLATNRKDALKDLDASLSRMKTDYVDLWQVHALQSPRDVEERVQNGVLDAFLEAQKKGKVRHIGFTGHGSYKAHLKMLEELKKRGVKMAASQMPVNPADPHYESFVTHVVPKCVAAGIGVLAMKALAYGRFFGGNKGWRRTEVSVKPVIPAVLSMEDVFGFVWSLPITTLVSGMQSAQQVSQNAAIARKTWNWKHSERQERIDAVAPFAGPDLEFYKS
ncbi:MAG: aldo/keto reductase [Desulfobacterales bacterium]|jgi:aryl-alcohol dehydrogenase-like predicted oxidoreductase